MKRTPRTLEEVAELEAAYQPFEPAAGWLDRACDIGRWQRHADALLAAVDVADAGSWVDVRERFLRAAALDSSALSELVRPMPEVSAVVLQESIDDEAWARLATSTDLVIECHRRALVVAADAAADGRPVDENLIARLQDLIVESQQTYTVTIEDGTKLEVDLPRRQYKAVSNYLRAPDLELVPFAPARRVAEEMQRLAAEIASDEFGLLHPVVQSAFLHVSLTHVHPFADGNGRLARTLASIPMLREVGLPQLVMVDQWPAYLQALRDENGGDAQTIIDLFLRAQVNTMSLATGVLHGRGATFAPSAPLLPATAAGTLLDLATVQLRALLAARSSGRVAVTATGADPRARHGVRAVVADEFGRRHVDVVLHAEEDGEEGWVRLVASSGTVLEVGAADLLPVPVEIVQLRVHAWLEGLLHDPAPTSSIASPAPGEVTAARALFVLGSPRSGTTMMGNYLGSHPEVLGLSEYGAFYVAHSVAPAYLARLPGREHDGFAAGLRDLAAGHAGRVARAAGCGWYCDATPWNLEVASSIAAALPDAVFVLMLRHFSGAVLSLRKFGWAGGTAESAARLWVQLNERVGQLPAERTLVIGYDALAADPAATIPAIGAAMASLGLDPGAFDVTQFTTSHAAIIGEPRPTIAGLVDGQVVLQPIASLDEDHWTPEVHELVWPIVADTHRALSETFAEAYCPPPRPQHVPSDQW